MDKLALRVPSAPVSERIVATVAAVLEEAVLHAAHALGVEIALQLSRQT